MNLRSDYAGDDFTDSTDLPKIDTRSNGLHILVYFYSQAVDTLRSFAPLRMNKLRVTVAINA